jgi:hypothetical protein
MIRFVGSIQTALIISAASHFPPPQKNDPTRTRNAAAIAHPNKHEAHNAQHQKARRRQVRFVACNAIDENIADA